MRCGAGRDGAWQEDVDKNKMDNHLPYKLELENMPAIKEGKIKTAFAKGGREWEGGRVGEWERERECAGSASASERRCPLSNWCGFSPACLPAWLAAWLT